MLGLQTALHAAVTLAMLGEPGPASNSWKLGDGWLLGVQMFDSAGKGEERLIAEYAMTAVVLGDEVIDGKKAKKVDFILTSKPLPADLTGRHRVHFDSETGWPLKAMTFRDYSSLPLLSFGKEKCYLAGVRGYPLEMLPAIKANYSVSAANKWELELREEESGLVRLSKLSRDGAEVETIRQVWRPNEPFWSEYERRRGGRLDLRAKRKVSPVTLGLPKATKTDSPEKPPEAVSPPKESPPPAKKKPAEWLAGDPDLEAPFSFESKNGTVSELVSELQKKTKQPLAVEESSLKTARVGFAVWRNIPVWKIMSDLERSPNPTAKWSRTSDGYVLSQPTTRPAAPESPQAIEVPPRSIPGYYWLIAALGWIAAAILGLMWFRKGKR